MPGAINPIHGISTRKSCLAMIGIVSVVVFIEG